MTLDGCSYPVITASAIVMGAASYPDPGEAGALCSWTRLEAGLVDDIRGIIRVIILALLCTAPLGGCSLFRSDGATSQAVATGRPATDYIVGPGDRLSVFVYQSPQLSIQSLPVRPDGRISLPLVPDLVATGKTPTQIGNEISDRLKAFVKDPNVTVMVQDFYGPLDRQVRVIGEAAEPQAIAYRDRMTLLDVMIQTKGLTRFAAGNRAVIVRRVNGKTENIPVRLADLIKDGDVSQNVDMTPGDVLIVPQTYF